MSELLRIAKNNLVNARDDLYRARNAAESVNPDLPYGLSGKALREIIVEYEDYERRALNAVLQAESLG